MSRASLKDLAARGALAPVAAVAAEPAMMDEPSARTYRIAQTRTDTRQVSGHFKADVAQTLRLIAVEQDRDIQEILAEALNMVFERYGKPVRAEVTSGRRRKS
jgi:hypothetical protein